MSDMILSMLGLAIVAFVQNMAFTWSSRSRNSGDPNYHRYAAWASNGIWYLCQIINIKILWEPITTGDWKAIIIGFLVYTVATTEGSVFMMKKLIKKETGKRKVGA